MFWPVDNSLWFFFFIENIPHITCTHVVCVNSISFGSLMAWPFQFYFFLFIGLVIVCNGGPTSLWQREVWHFLGKVFDIRPKVIIEFYVPLLLSFRSYKMSAHLFFFCLYYYVAILKALVFYGFFCNIKISYLIWFEIMSCFEG